MMTYKVWEVEIQGIKNSCVREDLDDFIEFLTLVIATPPIIIIDILLLPIELLYYLFKKIK